MPRRRLSFFGFLGLYRFLNLGRRSSLSLALSSFFFFFLLSFFSFSFLFNFLEMAGPVPSLEE